MVNKVKYLVFSDNGKNREEVCRNNSLEDAFSSAIEFIEDRIGGEGIYRIWLDSDEKEMVIDYGLWSDFVKIGRDDDELLTEDYSRLVNSLGEE